MTTSVRKAKSQIQTARTELDSARAGIDRDLAPWRDRFRQHRTAWIVAGGFAGGFALSWLPPKLWARIGSVVGGSAAIVARSLLTPMIAGALLARKDAGAEAVTSAANREPSAPD